MRVRFASILVPAILLSVTATHAMETIVSVDAFLASERERLAVDCRTVEFGEGFVTHVNVDGDGREDLLVDYHAAQCDGSSALFCGSGGCDMLIYLQRDDRSYALLTSFFGYVVDFDMPNANPPSFVVALHGNECGLSGMEPCAFRYKIEGGEAVEVGQVPPPEGE